MNLVDFTLRLDLPADKLSEMKARLQVIANEFPGGPEKTPVLRVHLLGKPVGDCFGCGGLACELPAEGEGRPQFRCSRCGTICEGDVLRRTP